jgi:hypothetical protein
MTTRCGAYLVFVVIAGLTPARAAGQPTGAVVRAIQIVEDGGITRVTIDADGTLPLPLPKSLENPPRIFLDLAGVTHKIRGTTAAQGGGVVSRVRVALNTVSPPVTRVVLDLTRPESFRVDIDARQSGRISVIVGSESAINPGQSTLRAAAPPAALVSANSSPSAAPSRMVRMPAPPVPAGNSTPAVAKGLARSPVLSPEAPRAPLPTREVEVYRKQTYGELARMSALRALVARIDAGENVGSETLASAAQEFTDLRRKLEAVRPSAVLAVTHDLLMTSCTLGAMASRLGMDAALAGNPETRQHAQSAAAGSMMLFDRACADLGCTRAPR